MTALTKERDTIYHEIERLDWLPVAAGVVLWQGGIVAINAAGFAVPAGPGVKRVAGRAEKTVDNRGGAAGDRKVEVRRAIFLYSNGAGGEALTLANRYDPCYALDDQTVQLTDAGGTLPLAGVVDNVEPAGVWVHINPLVVGV